MQKTFPTRTLYTLQLQKNVKCAQKFLAGIRIRSGNRTVFAACYSTKPRRYLGSNLLPETWILQTGNYETDQQAITVAKELGIPAVLKPITPNFMNTKLQGAFGNFFARNFGNSGINTDGKMPKFVIAASDMAIPACLEIKNKSGRKSFVAFIGKPNCFLGKMDAIMMSLEEKMLIRRVGPSISARKNLFFSKLPIAVSLENGEKTCTNSINLTKSKSQSNGNVAKPYQQSASVFIGSCIHPSFYQMSISDAKKLVENLKDIFFRYKYRINIYFSKLTPTPITKVIKPELQMLATKNPGLINIFDPAEAATKGDFGSNTDERIERQAYLGFMGSADKVIVTPESLITISSALQLKKPVYVINQEQSKKILRQIHQQLNNQGLAKRLYLEASNKYAYMLDSQSDDEIDKFSATSVSHTSNGPSFFNLKTEATSARRFAEFILNSSNKTL